MLKVEPMDNTFSVVITTAGRKSTNDAVASAISEKCPVILVSDGVDLSDADFPCKKWNHVTFLQLGRNYGRMREGICYYGQIAQCVGLYMSKTEFTMLLGDDDELVPGSASVMRKKMFERPDVDIWVPTIQYNDGKMLCYSEHGCVMGNVSHPTYRTTIIPFVPIHHNTTDDQGSSDYHHLDRCEKAGYKIGWFDQPCVLIRPNLPGRRGFGKV